MNIDAFRHRSGRVISLSRVLLTAAFLFAIWIDPSQPSRYQGETYALLAAYVAAALIYLALTWSNWWLEARLAPAALVADILLFGMIVFATEGGYTSPFFTFSVFILLSALIKWSWRETGLAAVAIFLIFMLAGVTSLGEGDFELARFLVRASQLLILSLLLIWFGVSMGGRGAGANRLLEPDGGDGVRALIRPALDHARLLTGGGRAALAWWDKEEPWVNIAILGDEELAQERHGFGDFPALTVPQLEDRCFLFDRKRCRALVRRGRHLRPLRLGQAPLDPAFANLIAMDAGLAIPIDAASHGGLLLIADVPGLCSDDLTIGAQLGRTVSAALDRAARDELTRESVATRTRLGFARDLHDSVVQLLAGTAFRLEAIRKAAGAGRAVDADIDALQHELAAEQRELRRFIGDLRSGEPGRAAAGLAASVGALVQRMTRQWGVDCTLVRCPPLPAEAEPLDPEVQQLIREGVANAVRHGGATRVEISLDSGELGLSLIIADNGRGFPVGEDASTATPWSLNERVHDLGGTLALFSSEKGTRITISLPFIAVTLA